MNKAEIAQKALTLAEHERFELAHTLWASLEDPNACQRPQPLPAWQRELLDERLEASANEEGETWQEVREQIWPRQR